jgi:16S rRNA (cytidine1402-2'-O)-methyltransferase
LYVVGAPYGDPEDLTLRAARILSQVALVLAEDWAQAGRLLAAHGLDSARLVPLTAEAAGDRFLERLADSDLALLVSGRTLLPSAQGADLVSQALARGWPVVPVPGPSLPVTALVVSGLPADSFVDLGRLPTDPAARRALLTALAGQPRTLVALVSGDALPEALADLHATLGERPLALTTVPDRGPQQTWRGALSSALGLSEAWPSGGLCVLVIGGAAKGSARWTEEQLQAEVRALLGQGVQAREIGARLAPESGWPRREIYRLAVRMS